MTVIISSKVFEDVQAPRDNQYTILVSRNNGHGKNGRWKKWPEGKVAERKNGRRIKRNFTFNTVYFYFVYFVLNTQPNML